MLDFTGTLHPAAEAVADALVAQADAQYRQARSEALNHIAGDASLLRRARPGGNDDAFRRQLFNPVKADFIVAEHPHLFSQLAEVLVEVVGKAIVIVN